MISIRLRLLKLLIGPILLINLAGAALTYALAWMPAQSAFDQSLADAAGALGARLLPGGQADGLRLDLPLPAEQVLRADQVDAVYFVVRGKAGQALAGDLDFPALRAPGGEAAPLAYDGVMRGEPVRIVSLGVRAGGQTAVVGVAKTLRKRLQIRSAILRVLILLETLLMLGSVGLIWFSVGVGLLPLNRMRADLNGRGGEDLAPVAIERAPYELEPVVHAFNGLLDKVRDGARTRHDFLANVAHQLRTPLAGLRTQLEWLAQRHRAEPETAHSIRLMRSSVERMIRQTNQLLALARAAPGHFEKRRLEPLRLDQLVQESIQHFVEEAAKKQIDLGFDLEPTVVAGDRFLLRDLIDNLIDNAVRYTPPAGVVTVACRQHAEGGMLAIEDSGPGIAPAKRELVFERFVRLDDKSSGSGLGLAIVHDIAVAHGASLEIKAPPSGRGMLFCVRFPLVAR
jgi:two-component system sensor histidine kinase TctE